MNVAGVKAISEAYGSRFYHPLDFEIFESHMPFYQSALEDRLEYELTFNDYSRVIVSDGDGSYTIENISLEFDMVTNVELARMIRNQYASRLAILYVLRHRKIVRDKSDTLWNINLNVLARSMGESCCSSRTRQLPSNATPRPSITPKLPRWRCASRASQTSYTVKVCAHTSSGTRPESFTQAAPSGTPLLAWSRKILLWRLCLSPSTLPPSTPCGWTSGPRTTTSSTARGVASRTLPKVLPSRSAKRPSPPAL